MEDSVKINNVMLMTEEDDEEIVAFYLSNAKEVIFHQIYPFGDDEEFEIPSKYDMLQCRIAAVFVNKRGAESELGHSENGIVRTYGSEDVPASMLREIVPKAVVL